MTTREAVLAALRAAGATGLSGEALAQSLGVSRVAIGKHVAALREAGYEIEADPGVGYRLISVPDGPLPAEVAPLLADASWMVLTGGGETGSTNDDARALAREGAPEGTVVLASSADRRSGTAGTDVGVARRRRVPLGRAAAHVSRRPSSRRSRSWSGSASREGSRSTSA